LTLASRERWERHAERAIRAGYIEPNPRVSYEELKEFHEKGDYRIEVARETHMKHEFQSFDTILPYLFERKWTFMQAPRGSAGFITCDHPVTLTWSDARDRGRFYAPPGFGLEGTDVLFPISPRLAIVGAFEIENTTVEIGDDMVALFNGAAVASAQRQVYARDHNFRYSFRHGEEPRKASRLLRDNRFLRVKADARTEGDDGRAASEG
jgi:hypothetical protein